jgi:NAD(P)-dependent dehydrogenase (short-subunit alcohol dehydrogenase family)
MLKEFDGRTAVVTGAASGIGLGLARQCGARGMNVVMLDVEEGALAEAASLVGDADHVLTRRVDVTDPEQVEAAAVAATERFGDVHLLCNNAGVSVTGPLWSMTDHDCRWVTGVNLFGVMNGVRSFVPGMLAHGSDAHVVNTASLAGLTPMPHATVYSATKAAVVALSECMWFDLRDAEAKVGVSVLCPGLVNTNIMTADRNRPAGLTESGDETFAAEAAIEFFRTTGDDPRDVADRVLAAVERDDFYILTGEGGRPDIAARAAAWNELGEPARPNPASIIPDKARRG